jgi:hypothetical protein
MYYYYYFDPPAYSTTQVEEASRATIISTAVVENYEVPFVQVFTTSLLKFILPCYY